MTPVPGPRLEIRSGVRAWTLDPGDRAEVGRGAGCRIAIEGPFVSRVHAVVHYQDGWRILDADSANGLWVNGVRTGGALVATGDLIGLGNPAEGATVLRLSELRDPESEPPAFSGHAPATRSVAAEPAAATPSVVIPTTPRPTMPGAVAAHTVPPALPDTGATQGYRVPRASVPASPWNIAIGEPSPTGSPDLDAAAEHRLTIGRGAHNDLALGDVLASREHAVLSTTGTIATLRDLDSLNGTFVNDHRLTGATTVHPGDRVVIGNSDFTIAAHQGRAVLLAADSGGGLVVDAVGFSVPIGRQRKTLLTDVEMRAGHGQLVAVIGPSGAGKSTLMNVMNGSVAPDAGAVYFDGHDITTEYELMRSRIGFVPQEDIIHRGLTVAQALGYAARLRLPPDTTPAERRARTRTVMETLGLLEHADTRVEKLSGGQRKRASVALELLTEPSLLILDEPTSGLDPAMDKQVTEMLRALADAGRVVVVVTHNVANLGLCDQVLILAKGGLPAYVGPPTGVLERFGAGDWAGLFEQATDRAPALYERFRRERPRRAPLNARPRTMAPAAKAKAPRRSPAARQVAAIASRQWRLLLADRGYSLFLALLPLVLGVLVLIVPGTGGFGVQHPAEPREAMQLLVVMIFGASFLGMALTVRDLVGERTIYRREASVGLDAGPYLLAKTLVYTVIALFQSAVLTLIVLLGKPAPVSSLFTYIPGLELYAAVAATAVACAFLGLMISSLVRSSDQVMPLLVVTAMVQLVLCGGIIPVTGRAVLEQLSWLAPARWGFAAGASSMDFPNLLQGLPEDRFWVHGADRYVFALGAMAVIALLCWLITWRRLAVTGSKRG